MRMFCPRPMNYAIAILLIASLLPFATAVIGPDGRETEEWDYEWLLIVYMAADNSLGENGTYGNAAWMDIEEMEGVMPQDGVRALVLSDMKGDGNTRLFDSSGLK